MEGMLRAIFYDNTPTHCLFFIFITNLCVLRIDRRGDLLKILE